MNHIVKIFLFVYFIYTFSSLLCTCQNYSLGPQGYPWRPEKDSNNTFHTNRGTLTNRCPEGTPSHIIGFDEKGKIQEKCGCDIGLLYHNETKTCNFPYRRGPCKSQEYLVADDSKKVGKCEKNNCLEDGLVHFNGSCYHLYQRGPCDVGFKVTVHLYTYDVFCAIEIIGYSAIVVPNRKTDILCPPGQRRTALGKCRQPL